MKPDLQRVVNRDYEQIQELLNVLGVPTHNHKGTLLLSDRVLLVLRQHQQTLKDIDAVGADVPFLDTGNATLMAEKLFCCREMARAAMMNDCDIVDYHKQGG